MQLSVSAKVGDSSQASIHFHITYLFDTFYYNHIG